MTLDFSFTDQTRESLTKEPYEVGIHSGNVITSAEYVEEYDAIDITFENPTKNWRYRDRLFNPVKGNTPDWTTPEKQLAQFQAKIKHILCRFIPEEQCRFSATTFKEMADKVIEILQAHAIDPKVEFILKMYFDKSFEYPELARNRFMALPTEAPLSFSKWEKENRLISEEISDSEGEQPSEDEIF